MKLWIRVVFSAAVLAVLFTVLPWNEVRHAVATMPIGRWLAILALFLVGHQVGVVKWRLMVNAGRASLRLADAVRCYAAGLFANLCLPSIVGGDVLRAALAGRATRRPEAVAWGGIADRYLDVVALGSLILAGAALNRGRFPAWGARLLVVVFAILIGGAVVTLVTIWRVPLHRWPRRVRRPIGRSLVAMRRMARAPSAALAALALAITIQGGFVLLNAWIGQGVGIAVPASVWFLVWPLAKLAALAPISLNGLGVRDATQGALLLSMGVPAASGVVASLLWQSVLIGGGLAAGGLWWSMGRRRAAGSPSRPGDVLPLFWSRSG